jgi:hypothetical protein
MIMPRLINNCAFSKDRREVKKTVRCHNCTPNEGHTCEEAGSVPLCRYCAKNADNSRAAADNRAMNHMTDPLRIVGKLKRNVCLNTGVVIISFSSGDGQDIVVIRKHDGQRAQSEPTDFSEEISRLLHSTASSLIDFCKKSKERREKRDIPATENFRSKFQAEDDDWQDVSYDSPDISLHHNRSNIGLCDDFEETT